jgi:pimeloyl-ACP methyl ester carboxylesterase
MADIAYRTADVDGLTVFYREAGAPDAPTLVLLHGFPSASHMFRELIPLLADRFHIVAPDLPGFGKSDMPVPGILSREQAAAARGVGQERPVLPAGRGRSLQARHPRR